MGGHRGRCGGLHEAGPDEALCCIWDTIDGHDDIANRLAEVRASGHPEAEHVASSVEAFAASGAPLTIRRGVELKVALKYAKPPVWRGVQLPLTATLGDLHAAIQVLFGWDGDHLHVFHAGGVCYSDPFTELEGTEDQEDARLRDAFRPGVPKITYVYDFGADLSTVPTRSPPQPAAPECTLSAALTASVISEHIDGVPDAPCVGGRLEL